VGIGHLDLKSHCPWFVLKERIVKMQRRQCVTQRIYPSRQDALGVSLFCKGGSAKVLSLNAWDMAATNSW
jgi:beta-fructofuranosidase